MNKGIGRKILIGFLIAVIAFLLGVVVAILLLKHFGEANLEKNVVTKEIIVEVPVEVDTQDDENLVVYKGERYWRNENLISILCMGVDRTKLASADEMVIGGNGQADVDVLVTIDKVSGDITLCNISRDTMVDVDRYDMDGKFIDTKKEQLCLSYAFGNGKETSCENTALSVSRLLYGMPINAYVAMDFASLATLNDAIGGVTVPITEEIAHKFPDSKVGEMRTLHGEEAVTYIRTRDTGQLDSNMPRMDRQKAYLIAFAKQLKDQLKGDMKKALSIVDSVSDEMVTNLDISEIAYFGSLLSKGGFSGKNLTSIEGKVIEGTGGFAEFIPDEKALYEKVLELFYTKE